jgi:nitric-oxide synthase
VRPERVPFGGPVAQHAIVPLPDGTRSRSGHERRTRLSRHPHPRLAEKLGLDTTRESTLWRDRALVELNRAVLWSFERAGVKITDHHTEARRFIAHVERERRAGRRTPADWTWIVPPMSGAATPVFHRYYHEADERPNFYLDPVARDLARLGRADEPAPPARIGS